MGPLCRAPRLANRYAYFRGLGAIEGPENEVRFYTRARLRSGEETDRASEIQRQGVTHHADRNRGIGTHGRQYRTPAYAWRASVRCLRPQSSGDRSACEGRRDRRKGPWRSRREAVGAARGLADAAGRQDYRRYAERFAQDTQQG